MNNVLEFDMQHKKIMFKQIGLCMEAIERVFGDQFALCVKIASEKHMDITVVVFVETDDGTKQVQVTTILDDPKKYPDYTVWVQRVIDALKNAVSAATTTPEEPNPNVA